MLCAPDWPGSRRAWTRSSPGLASPLVADGRSPIGGEVATRDLRPYLPGRRARADDHRLGPLGAGRGARWTRRSTSSSTASGSGSRSRASSTSRPTGGALLVSNHAGALPPDAAMIAKAIKEEHPRPRPLHLTVEHFFRGYPGLLDAPAQDRRGAGPPGQRPPPALRRGAARARLPRGAQGDREALPRPLPAAPLRPGRVRRGGDAGPRADRPDRGRRRGGGDAGLRPARAAQAPDGPALRPDHADLPALRACSAWPTCRRSSSIRFLPPVPHRRPRRRAVGGQGARADVAHEVRASIQEELSTCWPSAGRSGWAEP